MNKTQKQIAKKEAGKIIIASIQDLLDQSLSPVEGGVFKPMLKDGTASLLFEDGDMRSAIKAKPLESDHVEVGVYKKSEIKKAYGHNSGFKGHPNEGKLKKYKREFIPATNKKFESEIMDKVNTRIREIKDGSADTKIKKTVSELLDEAFESATTESVSGGSELSFTVGGFLEALND